MTSHYETLGVSPEATTAEITAAWRRAASRRHPDRGHEDEAAFHAARRAYEILRDPVKREEYDLAGVVVDTKNLETEAADFVAQMFSQFLAAEEDSLDPVADVLRALRQQLASTQHELHKAQRMFERARKRRSAVRRRGEGHDMFAAVAKKAVMATYAQVQHIKHGTKVFTRAIEIAEEYENGPPPEPQSKEPAPLRIDYRPTSTFIDWGQLR